jgi:hypothetical protein
LLKAGNFTYSTSRIHWRFNKERIDVIEIRSFNSYLAGRVGCTTYFFSIWLGSHLTCISPKFGSRHIKCKADHLMPREYNCHFGEALKGGIEQPEPPRKDVWHIDPDLRYLDSATHDA